MRALSVTHPILVAAAAGRLPDWAVCGEQRRGHVGRVADLLDDWSSRLGLDEREQARWRAAGSLHDALKDASPEDLRDNVDPRWPEPVLHGPACAARLQAEGVDDEEFLLAVAFHSVGHPSFKALGEHLYLADYLEPGRNRGADERMRLRASMPEARDATLRTVIARRLERLVKREQPILEETIAFWNRVTS